MSNSVGRLGVGVSSATLEFAPSPGSYTATIFRWWLAAQGSDGSIDFRGPLVSGRRGDRFLYLNWGTVAEDGTFELFRRAKVGLSELDPTLVAQALDRQADLRCTVQLTDAKGKPVCARLRPPAIEWRLVDRMS